MATTAFLLVPLSVGTHDLAALRRYVRAVAISSPPAWRLTRCIARGERAHPRARSAFVHEDGLAIETGGATEWRDENLVAVRRAGRGTVVFLADSSPLQHRLLGTADDAAIGLALAGPRHRPVEFLESYHGYGTGTGLSALPLSWKLLLSGLGLAALVYMVARGRRFGPPEPEGRSLPPPRRDYVDSLAAVVARSKQRNAAVDLCAARPATRS